MMRFFNSQSRLFKEELKVLRRTTKNVLPCHKLCYRHLQRFVPASVLSLDYQNTSSSWNYKQNVLTVLSRNSNFHQYLHHNSFSSLTSKGSNCLTHKSGVHLNQVQHRYANFSAKSFVDASPTKIQPYLRLLRVDRPIGTYLLFWPCTWSIGLAAQSGCLPDIYMLTLFGIGSLVMRGAGCIINDLWDKDIDKMVERTKTRPLASGELTSLQALVFLGGNLSIALTILLQLNWSSVYLGAASMILVVAYPLAKRYTYWPQFVLGVTLNWGVLLAWSALKGGIEMPVLPLYMACILYTMFYDTVYSHQDKYDDMLIGVKSTALKFGDNTKPWLAGFSTGMIGCLFLTGHLTHQTWPYYTALVATAAHLAHQLYTVDLDNSDDCLKKFKSNTQLGAVMFIGIVLGTLLKTPEEEEEKTKEIT